MEHPVGTLVHHLTTIYVCSVTCPQLEYLQSQIHYNISQRHLLSQKQPQLSPTSKWIHNCNYERPPKDNYYFFPVVMQQQK